MYRYLRTLLCLMVIAAAGCERSSGGKPTREDRIAERERERAEREERCEKAIRDLAQRYAADVSWRDQLREDDRDPKWAFTIEYQRLLMGRVPLAMFASLDDIADTETGPIATFIVWPLKNLDLRLSITPQQLATLLEPPHSFLEPYAVVVEINEVRTGTICDEGEYRFWTGVGKLVAATRVSDHCRF